MQGLARPPRAHLCLAWFPSRSETPRASQHSQGAVLPGRGEGSCRGDGLKSSRAAPRGLPALLRHSAAPYGVSRSGHVAVTCRHSGRHQSAPPLHVLPVLGMHPPHRAAHWRLSPSVWAQRTVQCGPTRDPRWGYVLAGVCTRAPLPPQARVHGPYLQRGCAAAGAGGAGSSRCRGSSRGW